MSELEQPSFEQGPVKQGRIRSIYAAAIVGAAAVSYGFEQSPLNEALRTNIGLDVLETTQSAPAVGLTIGAVTVGIEMGSAGLISLGLDRESKFINRMKERVSKKNQDKIAEGVSQDEEDNKKSKVVSSAADLGIALGVGAGVVTIRHHLRDDDPSLKKDLITSTKASAVVASVSGGVGYLAAGGIAHANDTIFEWPAEKFVEYGTDTKFWVSLLAAGYAIHYAKKGFKKLKAKREHSHGEDQELFTEPTPTPADMFKREKVVE